VYTSHRTHGAYLAKAATLERCCARCTAASTAAWDRVAAPCT
jgi:hypothetical protein